MRVRLLDLLCKEHAQGLVKDAEGDVVSVVVHPLEADAVAAAIEEGRREIYLRYVPLGVWIRMCKYTGAPFVDDLTQHSPDLATSATRHLVFVEPQTSEAFVYRGFRIVRTGFPLSHGKVVTSTACQGRTYRDGVVVDCGRHDTGLTRLEDDAWWLDLYVMLSRATHSDDIILVRPPPVEFLARGPPADLREALQKFASRTDKCRKEAERLAHQLGFSRFFH
jgi:hypothetical protein